MEFDSKRSSDACITTVQEFRGNMGLALSNTIPSVPGPGDYQGRKQRTVLLLENGALSSFGRAAEVKVKQYDQFSPIKYVHLPQTPSRYSAQYSEC